ncbi:MAG: alanine racemase [Alphaproteobacteria bacterium]|nr:alanine racemase [Alphaproteobacteria bacterium]MDX5463184.1 alanine racemase [Alphaproteobacteria bacterium]
MSAEAGSAVADSVLTIDLDALAENWRSLAAKAPHAECGATVKADAYGLGIARVAPALWAAGCRTFFVAHLDEGIALRAILPEATIHVFNGRRAETDAEFVLHRLRPVLNTLEDLDAWAALAGTRDEVLPATLHVDTGMSRLGLDRRETARLIDAPEIARAAHVTAVMSHLARAEDADDPMNAEQLARFEAVRAVLPGVAGSLANTGGVLLGPAYQQDLMRPGIGLYGGEPFVEAEPVVTLGARILQVREIGAGETVGYGATWTAARPSRIATVACGYADGYIRAAGNRAHGRLAGRDVPMVGRVSMDLITFDVTDAPPEDAHPGALIEMFGPGVRIDRAADAAGTIAYEFLTRLGTRFERVYTGGHGGTGDARP